MCFLSSHAVSVNGARHNNELAHRHTVYAFIIINAGALRQALCAETFMRAFERRIIRLNAYINRWLVGYYTNQFNINVRLVGLEKSLVGGRPT